MNKYKKGLQTVFCLWFCLAAAALYAQSSALSLQIKQFVSGEYVSHVYVWKENTLSIFAYGSDKNGAPRQKKIHAQKIKSPEILKTLHEKTLALEALDSAYVRAYLGGLRWEITLQQGDRQKNIVIENTAVPEVNALFEYLNTLIPPKKPPLHTF